MKRPLLDTAGLQAREAHPESRAEWTIMRELGIGRPRSAHPHAGSGTHILRRSARHVAAAPMFGEPAPCLKFEKCLETIWRETSASPDFPSDAGQGTSRHRPLRD